jgi:hypothetical protein
MTIWLEATIDYSCKEGKIVINGEGCEKLTLEAMYASDLEELESELETIASQIREFRMKNFPESDTIE